MRHDRPLPRLPQGLRGLHLHRDHPVSPRAWAWSLPIGLALCAAIITAVRTIIGATT